MCTSRGTLQRGRKCEDAARRCSASSGPSCLSAYHAAHVRSMSEMVIADRTVPLGASRSKKSSTTQRRAPTVVCESPRSRRIQSTQTSSSAAWEWRTAPGSSSRPRNRIHRTASATKTLMTLADACRGNPDPPQPNGLRPRSDNADRTGRRSVPGAEPGEAGCTHDAAGRLSRSGLP